MYMDILIVYISIYYMNTVPTDNRKDSMGLEFQMVVSALWVLEIEPWKGN